MTLTVAQATSQATTTKWSTTDDITLKDSGSALAGLTFANFKKDRLGGQSVTLDASDDVVSLTTSQANALAAAGLKFADDDVVTVTGITDKYSCLTNDTPDKLGGKKVILSAAPDTSNQRLWNFTASSLSDVLNANIDFAADNDISIDVDGTSLTGTSGRDLFSFTETSGTNFTITNLGIGDYISFNRMADLTNLVYENNTLICTVYH